MFQYKNREGEPMKRIILKGFLAAALSMPLIAPVAAEQKTEIEPKIGAGKVLFDANCAVCHRASGAGGIHFGDAVSADLRSPGLETTYHDDDTLILRAILHAMDQNGAPLDAPMPAWSRRLSTGQAKEIVAYLHTLHS
jgi:mono/diheme cytochrome c family protein